MKAKQTNEKIKMQASERLRINGRFISKASEIFIKDLVAKGEGVASKEAAQAFIDKHKNEVLAYTKTRELTTQSGDANTLGNAEKFISTGKKLTVVKDGKKYRGKKALEVLTKFQTEQKKDVKVYYIDYEIKYIDTNEMFVDLSEAEVVRG